MKRSPLIGTWKLVSWELTDDAGQVSYPFGPDAKGYLTFTEDGHMSVIITTARRSHAAALDLLGGSVDEKAAAAETCVAYCGTYRIRGSNVLIHVDARLSLVESGDLCWPPPADSPKPAENWCQPTSRPLW